MLLIKKPNYKSNKKRINLGKIYELKTNTKAG